MNAFSIPTLKEIEFSVIPSSLTNSISAPVPATYNITITIPKNTLCSEFEGIDLKKIQNRNWNLTELGCQVSSVKNTENTSEFEYHPTYGSHLSNVFILKVEVLKFNLS